jgi:hypothetical protein
VGVHACGGEQVNGGGEGEGVWLMGLVHMYEIEQ